MWDKVCECDERSEKLGKMYDIMVIMTSVARHYEIT